MGLKKYNKLNIDMAIMGVRNKEMGLLRTSTVFEVPKSTLIHKVKSTERSIEKLVSFRNGRRPILSGGLENVLVS
jgi:hypothetical protein